MPDVGTLVNLFAGGAILVAIALMVLIVRAAIERYHR